MIPYETFSQAFNSGEITKLHFTYQSKEYMIAREEGEEGPVFAFATEEQVSQYPNAKALLKYAIIGGRSLREIWYHIDLICNDTLLDDDYILTMHSDSLGKIMYSSSGTETTYDRYLTQHFVPGMILGALVILVLLTCTLFIAELSWTFFAIAAAIVVGAVFIAQLIFFTNTKKYRHHNPRAHFYLLNHGVVIKTTRHEYAIPYTKILRLDTEAGISIVTMRTVFNFTADHGVEMTEALKGIVDELKAIKQRRRKKKNQRSSTD